MTYTTTAGYTNDTYIVEEWTITDFDPASLTDAELAAYLNWLTRLVRG